MEAKLQPPVKNTFSYDEWTICSTKSHIMGHKCTCEINKSDLKKECNLCLFNHELNKPSLPDMVYADNNLLISCADFSIEFTAIDALKHVPKHSPDVKVSYAKEWREARADCKYFKNSVKDYDWTYSTNYCGTLRGNYKIVSSEERINLEKLKLPEKILFFDEIYLYEDELDDNGCTKCIVKVRVMPSGFFVVFRHYLRIDNVLIRVCDTRLYYEKQIKSTTNSKENEKSYKIIRETSVRESPICDIKVNSSVYCNPDAVWQHLKIIQENVHKICSV